MTIHKSALAERHKFTVVSQVWRSQIKAKERESDTQYIVLNTDSVVNADINKCFNK